MNGSEKTHRAVDFCTSYGSTGTQVSGHVISNESTSQNQKEPEISFSAHVLTLLSSEVDNK